MRTVSPLILPLLQPRHCALLDEPQELRVRDDQAPSQLLEDRCPDLAVSNFPHEGW